VTYGKSSNTATEGNCPQEKTRHWPTTDHAAEQAKGKKEKVTLAVAPASRSGLRWCRCRGFIDG